MSQEPSSEETANMVRLLHQVAQALQEEFGDRQPTDEEARSFMIQWLVAQGKSKEEAKKLLD